MCVIESMDILYYIMRLPQHKRNRNEHRADGGRCASQENDGFRRSLDIKGCNQNSQYKQSIPVFSLFYCCRWSLVVHLPPARVNGQKLVLIILFAKPDGGGMRVWLCCSFYEALLER